MKLKAAQSAYVLPKSQNITLSLRKVVCNENDKKCMYRECGACKGQTLEPCEDGGPQVDWFAWKSKRFEKSNEKKGTPKIVTMTVKEREQGSKSTSKKTMPGSIRMKYSQCISEHQDAKLACTQV